MQGGGDDLELDVELDLDLGLDPAVEGSAPVTAAHALARDLLEPEAARVDASVVPRTHLDALGRAGLLGLAAPRSAGGSAAPDAVARRVAEVLAAADLTTWFVQAQHHGPVRTLAAAGTRPELLAGLAAGRLVAGTAFSHLRRAPRRPVRAERLPGGWRLDGTAPWYTGWGINDVALLAGPSADGEVVWVAVPAAEGPGLRAGPAVPVAAVQGAATVPLLLDGLTVADEEVVAVQPLSDWAAADARATAATNPAVLGLIESAVRLLAAATGPGDRAARAAAEHYARRLVDLRGALRAVEDATPAPVSPQGHPSRELITLRGHRSARGPLALRAVAGRLAVEATSALVVAGGGRAMALAEPAQRKAREALFLLVQAQTRAAREALLAEWTDG